MGEHTTVVGNASPRIMAHCISHFPDECTSLEVARALACAGARYLEVQFPFSDPFADGALIQSACAAALEEPDAFTVAKGFTSLRRFIEGIAGREKPVTVFLMCYGNTAIAYGVQAFVQTAQRIGVSGLIIPDIPFDSDVGEEVRRACEATGLYYIPVAVVTSEWARLEKLVYTVRPQYLYMSLRAGITGAKTTIDEKLVEFLSHDLFASTRILGGFGIQSAQQVRALFPYVHACIVGSAFVRVIMNARERYENIPEAVERACRALLNTGS